MPTNEDVLSFDGVRPTLGEDSEWQSVDVPISGNDPLWLASITYRYAFSVSLWVQSGSWVVYPGGSTFRVQYAASATGPWVAADPQSEEMWVRYRLEDGTWSTHQVRGVQNRTWRTILDHTVPATIRNTSIQIPRMDMADIEMVAVSYEGDLNSGAVGVQGQEVAILIPSPFIRSVDPAEVDLGDNAIIYQCDRLEGSNWTRGQWPVHNSGSPYSDWYRAATADKQRGHLFFGGAAEGDTVVYNLVFFRGYSSVAGQLRVYSI